MTHTPNVEHRGFQMLRRVLFAGIIAELVLLILLLIFTLNGNADSSGARAVTLTMPLVVHAVALILLPIR